ncbi:MAG TPA: hypothetical protein DIT64_10000 [Verrucomicrobiales bacterium]|mgnify:CR=1 FL=1|nr:hypothetical protein [Verrucomicrobiales bacterium]HCN77285.1 hypothetical protein [Verrucomicrobiales bacterium]
MARHKLIEELHAAWYDALWATGEGADDKRKAHLILRDEACRLFDCSPSELQQALRGDFSKWCREKALPKPPQS